MQNAFTKTLREATRLTRTGLLQQATTAIQRALGGDAAVTPAPLRKPNKAAAASIFDAVRPPLTLNLFATEPLCGVAAPKLNTPPPAAAAGARFLSGSFRNAAGSRDYRLYVPSGYCGRPVPLVVMLHGCQQNADDFARGTRMNEAAEARGCIVVYPEQSSSANASRCWNWFSAADQKPDRGEPSLIAGITRQVMQDYRIDRTRVFVAGLSAGGAAAAIMGATYPELYAAIGVHSGLPYGAASDMASAFGAMRTGRGHVATTPGIATIVFHGNHDTTVHPSNGEQVIAQAGAATRQQDEDGSIPGGHSYHRRVNLAADGRVLSELWTIHGAGHAWAGGSPAGSYTDPRGPDASGEMLRFFLAQP